MTSSDTHKVALIIGAGPAGLTAAYELLKRTSIVPIVFEKDSYMGGLARTVNYRGNRLDVGGHRFFSKSDRVMTWWLQRLPLQRITKHMNDKITYHGISRHLNLSADGPDPLTEDRVMLLRLRKSRIYFLRKLFDYPISLSIKTLLQLGPFRVLQIVLSYLYSSMIPISPEHNLEDFFINRFGRKLYEMFFKSYTEKVWGIACNQIDPIWGAQRIKGLSIRKAVLHALQKIVFGSSRQTNIETSLTEQFLYPKYGPGQLWELVAKEIQSSGGVILSNHIVESIHLDSRTVTGIEIKDLLSGTRKIFKGDYFFSSMPIKDLITALQVPAPKNVIAVSEGLMYRNFINVGLLVKNLKLTDKNNSPITDEWIYIQEPDIRAGRLQIYNNWSPYLVQDPSKTWLGIEYFCNEGDDLWKLSGKELIQLASEEMAKAGIIEIDSLEDATVIKMPKAYPGYFGTYARFNEIRNFIDQFENLFLIGRNGMHKYNNQDHAMLTAMTAVDNIIAGIKGKDNLWEVNTEAGYLES